MDFRFPADVFGWLTEEEGLALTELSVGKRVLEVGSYLGRSTICLAQTALSVTCVDTFDGRGTTARHSTLAKFQANLSRYGVMDRVTWLVGSSKEVLPTLAERYDVAFIDASHDYASVIADATLALPLVKNGVMAFHDFGVELGVVRAVKELVRKGARIVKRAGSIAVLQSGDSA